MFSLPRGRLQTRWLAVLDKVRTEYRTDIILNFQIVPNLLRQQLELA